MHSTQSETAIGISHLQRERRPERLQSETVHSKASLGLQGFSAHQQRVAGLLQLVQQRGTQVVVLLRPLRAHIVHAIQHLR